MWEFVFALISSIHSLALMRIMGEVRSQRFIFSVLLVYQYDICGRELGFVGGNVPESGGGTSGIPKADNWTEGSATEGW